MGYIFPFAVVFCFGQMANDAFRATFGMDGVECILTMFALPLGSYLLHRMAITPKGSIFTDFMLGRFPLLLLIFPSTAALLYILFKGALLTSAGDGDWVAWSKYSAFLFLSFPVVVGVNLYLSHLGLWDEAADNLIAMHTRGMEGAETTESAPQARDRSTPEKPEFSFDPGRFGK